MTEARNYAEGVGQLREALARLRASADAERVGIERDQVLARFQPIFTLEHMPDLTVEEFVPFLYIENNKHWSSLYRQRSRLTADMEKLRHALGTLLDESHPIASRLDEAINSVHGLGKALATAVLLVAFPQKYGVWNNTSEGAMRELGLWPDFPWGTSLGKKYEIVNDLFLRLAADLEIDLWTLDILWWSGLNDDDYSPGTGVGTPVTVDGGDVLTGSPAQRFGLERHLHDFLRDNWDQTELGRDWRLYGEPGDDDPGYEFPTDVGYIDLLAHHRQEPRWLVVELKRAQTSDQTVGQILRYMGWVRRHLAQPDDQVEGLIIAQSRDEKLLYALEMQPQVDLRLYEVEFRLRPASALDAEGGTDH